MYHLANRNIIKSEFERIGKYKQKGDLSSEIEIIEYLNKRDRALSPEKF
jgi:hypothetical protein